MKKARLRQRFYRLMSATLTVALCATSLSSCAATTANVDASAAASLAPALPTPLATSVVTAEGTWASFPMGRLDQPANTFWQLFYLAQGASSWANQVEATATATNGGLVLAAGDGGRLTVAVRPSLDLTFTPLISTSDGARSWSDGLIASGLAARPDALAVGPSGDMLALVGKPSAAQVLVSRGGLSTWRRLVSDRQLATSRAGRRCVLGFITAVAYLGHRPVVAGSCGRAGVIGMLSPKAGSWASVAPRLPAHLGSSRAEVLAIVPGPEGTSVLVELPGKRQVTLLAFRQRARGTWSTSVPWALPGADKVISSGSAGMDGLFVLLRSGNGHESLLVQSSAGHWRRSASPPIGTQTVAFEPNGAVSAFAGRGSSLTIWSLGPGSGRWSRRQVVHVPIQYGSSS